jgi:tetratricopeptide (TPR) repeat protein
MGYPGDTSASREIQLRILSTFKQTLRHAERDRWEEAHLGCDFILRLDPSFEPARVLKRRMADDTVVDLDDLREIADQAKLEPGAGATAAATGLLIEDDGLDLDLDLDLPTTEEGDEEAGESDGGAIEFELELDEALSDLEMEGDQPEGLLLEPTPDEERPAEEESAEGAPIDRESEQRIAELLSAGQAAFDRQDYQQAIDAWSRIFLIDIDHVEASRLIDEARVLKAEAERELDEILHEGIAHLEAGEDAMARDAFNRVLALQPNHLVAKEYLGQLEPDTLGVDGDTASEGVAAPRVPEPERAPRKTEDRPELPRDPEAKPEEDELEEAEPEETETQAPAKSPRRSFVYIGTAVLLLAVGAGWYLFSRWDAIFPNSTQESSAAGTAGRPDPIARARNLHEAGNTPLAISQLERLSPDDPKYAEAQALIAQFNEPEADAEAEAVRLETSILVASLETELDQAYDDRRYLKASMILDRIAEIQPLSDEQTILRGDLDARLEPIETQIALIRQGEWEYALPQLWRMLDERPDDRDVLMLLVDGYFNLGVRDLQRGRPTEATEKFREALALSPDDVEIQRLDSFARAYQAQPQDLRYRIFIKYVPFR